MDGAMLIGTSSGTMMIRSLAGVHAFPPALLEKTAVAAVVPMVCDALVGDSSSSATPAHA